jgi:hypothetical protein
VGGDFILLAAAPADDNFTISQEDLDAIKNNTYDWAGAAAQTIDDSMA